MLKNIWLLADIFPHTENFCIPSKQCKMSHVFMHKPDASRLKIKALIIVGYELLHEAACLVTWYPAPSLPFVSNA